MSVHHLTTVTLFACHRTQVVMSRSSIRYVAAMKYISNNYICWWNTVMYVPPAESSVRLGNLPWMLFVLRTDSRFAPSQWETVLLCNDVSHWLGTNLESALILQYYKPFIISLTGPGSIVYIRAINNAYVWATISEGLGARVRIW